MAGQGPVAATARGRDLTLAGVPRGDWGRDGCLVWIKGGNTPPPPAGAADRRSAGAQGSGCHGAG